MADCHRQCPFVDEVDETHDDLAIEHGDFPYWEFPGRFSIETDQCGMVESSLLEDWVGLVHQYTLNCTSRGWDSFWVFLILREYIILIYIYICVCVGLALQESLELKVQLEDFAILHPLCLWILLRLFLITSTLTG